MAVRQLRKVVRPGRASAAAAAVVVAAVAVRKMVRQVLPAKAFPLAKEPRLARPPRDRRRRHNGSGSNNRSGSNSNRGRGGAKSSRAARITAMVARARTAAIPSTRRCWR